MTEITGDFRAETLARIRILDPAGFGDGPRAVLYAHFEAWARRVGAEEESDCPARVTPHSFVYRYLEACHDWCLPPTRDACVAFGRKIAGPSFALGVERHVQSKGGWRAALARHSTVLWLVAEGREGRLPTPAQREELQRAANPDYYPGSGHSMILYYTLNKVKGPWTGAIQGDPTPPPKARPADKKARRPSGPPPAEIPAGPGRRSKRPGRRVRFAEGRGACPPSPPHEEWVPPSPPHEEWVPPPLPRKWAPPAPPEGWVPPPLPRKWAPPPLPREWAPAPPPEEWASKEWAPEEEWAPSLFDLTPTEPGSQGTAATSGLSHGSGSAAGGTPTASWDDAEFSESELGALGIAPDGSVEFADRYYPPLSEIESLALFDDLSPPRARPGDPA